MISSRTIIAVVCLQLAAMVSVAVCDYQIEVNLISYNNSVGRLENGQCCDVKIGTCPLQETCDVQFTFSVENINSRTVFGDQDKVVGTYNDQVRLNFDNCSPFLNGVRNPLTFVIPSNQWRNGEIIRVLAEIVDADQSGIPASLHEIIMSSRPILLIQRPAAPFSEYTPSSSSPFFGPNSLSLTFEHRVICSTGTCGSDCSQTTNCLPFPSCAPLTCADSLCLNGGTCTLEPGSSFACNCREGFTGPNCGVIMPSSTRGDLIIMTSTATTPIISDSSQDTPPSEVQNCPITTAVVSSIIVFIFTSLIFLTIGMIIGYSIHKRKFTANSKNSTSTPPDKPATAAHTSDATTTSRAPPSQPAFPPPEYAPIHASVEQHVQGFGMKKCEAYAPSSQSTAIAGASPGGLGGQSTDSGRPEEHGYSPLQISTSNNYVSFHM